MLMMQNLVITRLRLAVLAVALLLATYAAAQNLPDYYPRDGFQRTGTLDAVYLDERRIVIGDVQFQLADNLIVHSPDSFSVPTSRLRIGSQVGYKLVAGRLINELWLLPDNYRERRR